MHVVLMSAYTLSSGEREKSRWSVVDSLRSNQMWMLMTGTPTSLSSRLVRLGGGAGGAGLS